MKAFDLLIASIAILPIVTSAYDFSTPSAFEVNLTRWREHRRKKRFVLFENAGILKLVIGITYPVDLGEKNPCGQLLLTYNLQYQFPVPPKPVYWWEKWNMRNFRNGQYNLNTPEILKKYRDEAQELIYDFAIKLMDRNGTNGRACLLRAICENAQIHVNHGLYAEILHRILQPQRNLHPDYTEAWHLGKRGMNCQSIYPEAINCLLDDYLHVREDFMRQHFVKDLSK